MNYIFLQQVKIVFGCGAVDQLSDVMKTEGFKNAFLVCDGVVRQLGVLERMEGKLKEAGLSYVIFDEVQPDPPSAIIDKGAKICREAGCDCVVAIGGGSAIDTGKGINLLRFNGGNILDYTSMEHQPGKGLIAIPTTAGTGSELSNGMIVTDTESQKKMAIIEYGEFAILDPELTKSMPASLTTATGLDVFSHAFEAYTSVLSNPMADLVCEKIMQEVCANLPQVLENPDDMDGRLKMIAAASMGGWMLANACAHVGHSLAHVLGAKYHIPHGIACSYTLPVTIEYISDVATAKVKKTGEILGVSFTGTENSLEIGQMTADAYRRFRDEQLHVKPIGEYHCDRSLLEACAEEVVTETFAGFTPKKVTEDDSRKMLKEILGTNEK